MTAADRSRRQQAADHAGREARIEAVTRDLHPEGYYATVRDEEDFDRYVDDEEEP